ncbi:hypothetical protein GOV09_06225 [Candidatus Woesearchaeota archaeon]|nr:hypothetical protein [Candidatus Woesearchaeota archaeon]
MIFDKSQVTAEFLFLISFLFVVSLGFIYAAGSHMKDFSDNQKRVAIEDFGESLKNELVLASVVKEGYERTIELPDKIDGTIDYTINVLNSTIVILADKYEFSFIVPKTEGALQKGTNIIRNIDQTVFIENA